MTLLNYIILKRNNSGAYLSREYTEDILSYRIKIFCTAGRSPHILMGIARKKQRNVMQSSLKASSKNGCSASSPPSPSSLPFFSFPSHILKSWTEWCSSLSSKLGQLYLQPSQPRLQTYLHFLTLYRVIRGITTSCT